MRTAAALAAARAGEGPGKCQQVWCPVCALAALVTGEEHPLLTVIAEHSVALLTVVRRSWSTVEATPMPPTAQCAAGPGRLRRPTGEAAAPGAGRYQPIPVTVED